MNFIDFYSKLLKNLYDCNFTLNLVKKNEVTLLQKYCNFTRSEFYGIFASLVLQQWRSQKLPCTELSSNLFIFIILLRHIGSMVLNFSAMNFNS